MNDLPADHPRVLGPGDAAGLAVALAEHPFTEGFDAAHVDALSTITARVEVASGRYVFRRGHDADALYLLTGGDVALEIGQPGTEPLVLQTLHDGDALGWSWLYPPYHWHWDARASTDVSALAIDAAKLRRSFAADPVFGLEVVWRVGELVIDRLQHARAQLVSVQLP